MSPLEDRLRDALNAAAAMVDERVERPLPERLPERRRAPRSSRRLLPVLAAAAVLLLLVGAVGLRYLVDEKEPVLRRVPGIPKFIVAVMPATQSLPTRVEVRD